jgi:hypothetical protein
MRRRRQAAAGLQEGGRAGDLWSHVRATPLRRHLQRLPLPLPPSAEDVRQAGAVNAPGPTSTCPRAAPISL